MAIGFVMPPAIVTMDEPRFQILMAVQVGQHITRRRKESYIFPEGGCGLCSGNLVHYFVARESSNTAFPIFQCRGPGRGHLEYIKASVLQSQLLAAHLRIRFGTRRLQYAGHTHFSNSFSLWIHRREFPQTQTRRTS